jgi:polar amino acid transport system substrate-binding protein
MASATARIIFAAAGLILLLVIVWLYASAEPSLADAYPQGTIRFAVDPTFPPFALDTGGELVGFDIDLAQAIGAEMGIAVQFSPISYDGLYDALLTGRVDAIISALPINPLKTKDVRYTQPYFDNGLVLVSVPESPIRTVDEVAEKCLAMEYGSVANGYALAWQRQILPFAVQPYELPTYALDAVRLGLCEAALVDYLEYRLYRVQHPDWDALSAYVSSTPYAIAVRANDYANWFWLQQTLERLQENGTFQRIFDRWMS